MRLLDLRQSFLVPKILKLLNRRRPVALKLVARVSVDQHAALPNLVAIIDPTAEFSGAINNGLVPEDEASASSWR